MPRTLSPYEINHLTRYQVDPRTIDQYGEMPVEYITGHVTFCGLDLTLTHQVLIPRLETEELADMVWSALLSMAAPSVPLVIAEVGTGSGAVGLTIIDRWLKQPVTQPLHLYLTDISVEAVAVAESNLTRLFPRFQKVESAGGDRMYNTEVAGQPLTVSLSVKDLLNDFPTSFLAQIMVANLPYIPHPRIAVLEDSVKAFEPHVALDGGADGLELIHRFLTQAPAHLDKKGQIFLEIDYTHTTSDLLPDDSPFQAQTTFDQFLRQRFGIITWKK